MVKHQNTSCCSVAILLSAFFLTVGGGALNSFAQHAFRANTPLPENQNSSVAKNTETATIIAATNPSVVDDPNQSYPTGTNTNTAVASDTNSQGAGLIQDDPVRPDSVKTTPSIEENSVSASEDTSVIDKNSSNASQNHQ